MWAGAWDHRQPQRMSLGFQSDIFAFELTCGFPQPSRSAFCFDAEIKEETIWTGDRRRPSTTLLERSAGITRVRDNEGHRIEYPLVLSENESVLAQLRDPQRYPELFSI